MSTDQPLEGELTETVTPTRKSLAVVRAAGREYPMVSVPACTVCRSPNRYDIERAIVEGAGFEATARAFSDPKLKARGIKNHFVKQHLPLLAEAVRQVDEEKRQERSELIEAGAHEMAAHLERSRSIVDGVSKRVLRGEIEPTMADGIKAAQLLQKADQSAADVDWSIVKIGLSACIQAVRDTLDDQAFEQFIDTVTSQAEVKLLLDQVGPIKVH